MSRKSLKGIQFLMAVCLLATLQWGCSKTSTTPTPAASGVPFTTLFSSFGSYVGAYSMGNSAGTNGVNSALNAAFSPMFASVGPFAAAGTGTWAVGMIMGMNVDESNINSSFTPISEGFAFADVSVANTAVNNAIVSLTPSGGSTISLSYAESVTYNGYYFSVYTGSLSSYSPTTPYTLSVSGIGDTATSTLTPAGGNAFSYPSGPDVTDTITNLGMYDASFVVGFQTTPSYAVTLSYYNAGSSSGYSSPYTFNPSDYSPLSSPATYYSGIEEINWTTTVSSATTIKGGLIGVGCGFALTHK